jgi:MFS family permease
VSALAGIAVGRVLDGRGPRLVMTGGAAVGVLALVAVAVSRNLLSFFAAWVVAGLAMASTFYSPAFAALTRWYGTGRVRALTIVTLAGGLASTVFAPLTTLLVTSFGWRTSVVVLAGVLAVVVVPLHWFGLRGVWPDVVEYAHTTQLPHSVRARRLPGAGRS